MGTTNCQYCGTRVYWSLCRGEYLLQISNEGGQELIGRYGSDLTPDQKDALLDVIRARPHPSISAEIRREIVNSVERGAPRPGEEDVVMR